MASTLSTEALNELAELMKLKRSGLSEIYREYRLSSSAEEIASARGDSDPRRVEDSLHALRVLFGRSPLPKRGNGRQAALTEARRILESDIQMSVELSEHLTKILYKGKRTNTRKAYEVEVPVPQEAKKPRKNGAEGRQAGVYAIARQDAYDKAIATGSPMSVKIGYSHNVWDRLANAQTWFDCPVKILKVWLTEEPKKIETRLQIALDALELTNEGGGTEWFLLRESMLQAIEEALELRDVAHDITPYYGDERG